MPNTKSAIKALRQSIKHRAKNLAKKNAYKGIIKEFGGSKIVMAPRSANDADIAVTAWTRVLKFDVSGEHLTDSEKDQIRAFYRGFKNRGPELVPDTVPGIDPKSVQP